MVCSSREFTRRSQQLDGLDGVVARLGRIEGAGLLRRAWGGVCGHGGGELVAGVDVEFAVGAGEVVTNGFGGDEQRLGDVTVTQGLGG